MSEKRCRLCGRPYANWPAHFERCDGPPVEKPADNQGEKPVENVPVLVADVPYGERK